ncbi:UDP-glucose 4-epimerase GalE [soil metagenome]
MPRILVTGGAGYIGSHTIVELLQAGHEVVCLDNFSNAVPEVCDRIAEIAGRKFETIKGDVRDAALLATLFVRPFDGVIHFAALKAVGESVAKPLAYYDNNVAGLVTLLQAMQRAKVRRFVFSSSATVYGLPEFLPFTEAHPIHPTSPYGMTKSMTEQILQDLAASDPAWSLLSLRYFNPIGAHPSGRIGEDPADIPNNLFPFITQVAVGKRPHVAVFGGDWPTDDGSGVRDYIHVVDLAIGHVKAIEHAMSMQGFTACNLGSGIGTSVLGLIKAFETASGVPIPYVVGPRRPGDIAAFWADPALAKSMLGWTAERGVDQMCADGWRWQKANPDGYRINPQGQR